MNDRRFTTFPNTLFFAALCALAICILAACAGEPEKKDRQLRKAATAKPAAEVEEPSAEELANSPCGNPDWAQLPAGAEQKAHDQQPDQQDEPDDGAKDGEGAPADTQEQSNRGELTSSDKPCT
jgi:hypothetical protein